MRWQLQSLICTLVGVCFLALGYFIERATWGSSVAALLVMLGIFLILTGLLHYSLNTLMIEFKKWWRE